MVKALLKYAVEIAAQTLAAAVIMAAVIMSIVLMIAFFGWLSCVL